MQWRLAQFIFCKMNQQGLPDPQEDPVCKQAIADVTACIAFAKEELHEHKLNCETCDKLSLCAGCVNLQLVIRNKTQFLNLLHQLYFGDF